jgi:hypothetical protein
MLGAGIAFFQRDCLALKVWCANTVESIAYPIETGDCLASLVHLNLLDLREGCLPSSWGKRTPVPIPLSTPHFTHEIGCGGLEEVRQREARAQPPPALDPCPKAEA